MRGGLSRSWLPVAVVLALGAYLWFHFQYPFWFIWDMDHTVLVDTLLIQSGKWPVHLHHPGFGLYLPLKWSHFFSYHFGFVSLLDISDIEKSVGPLLGVAELTAYLRLHSPFLAIAIVLLLWRSLTHLFALSRLKECGLFALLALQASLFYHSTMIRTELYAMFWWAMALHAFARSALAVDARREAIWVGAGGLFLALCLLTKVQGVIYVVGAFLLLLLFRAQAGKAAAENEWAVPRLRLFTAANLTFAVFLILGAALRRPYGATFSSHYNINFMGVGFLVANLGLFLREWGYLPVVFRRLDRANLQVFSFATLVMSGFLFAFLAHFAMYLNPATSYRYMLLDAKMVFFRNSIGASLDPYGYFLNFGGFVARHPALFAVTGAFFLAYLFRRPRRRELLLIGAITLVAFLSAFYGSRNYLRDLLWAETMVLFIALWLAVALSRNAGKGFQAFVGTCLLLALAGSCLSIARLRSDLDANYNLYGWGWERTFNGTYEEGHLQFAPALHARYGQENAPARRAAFRQAAQFRDIRRTASFVVANTRLDQKALGLAEEGQPVFADDPAARIEELPEKLRGGIVVDVRKLRLDADRFFEDRYVNALDERLSKRRAKGEPEAYSLLPRSDLDVFVVAEIGAQLDPSQFEEAGPVRLRLSSGPIHLRAWRLKAYAAQAKEPLGSRHFLVITGI